MHVVVIPVLILVVLLLLLLLLHLMLLLRHARCATPPTALGRGRGGVGGSVDLKKVAMNIADSGQCTRHSTEVMKTFISTSYLIFNDPIFAEFCLGLFVFGRSG